MDKKMSTQKQRIKFKKKFMFFSSFYLLPFILGFLPLLPVDIGKLLFK